MILCIGNIWNCPIKPHLLLFTANRTINKAGELVMGRGFALQVRQKYPQVAKMLGRLIKRHYINKKDYYIKYVCLEEGFNILGYEAEKNFNIGAFQVKRHFKDKADLTLVKQSINKLNDLARTEFDGEIIFLNFPAIGYGWQKDKERKILDMLRVLPDNVFVWKLA